MHTNGAMCSASHFERLSPGPAVATDRRRTSAAALVCDRTSRKHRNGTIRGVARPYQERPGRSPQTPSPPSPLDIFRSACSWLLIEADSVAPSKRTRVNLLRWPARRGKYSSCSFALLVKRASLLSWRQLQDRVVAKCKLLSNNFSSYINSGATRRLAQLPISPICMPNTRANQLSQHEARKRLC